MNLKNPFLILLLQTICLKFMWKSLICQIYNLNTYANFCWNHKVSIIVLHSIALKLFVYFIVAFLVCYVLFQVFFPETTDIYDKKNMPKLIYCIHALRLENNQLICFIVLFNFAIYFILSPKQCAILLPLSFIYILVFSLNFH